MASSSPTQIICGVTCACAEEQKAKARPAGEPQVVADCIAHDTCPHAKDGSCSCDQGYCKSSQNKKVCSHAVNGDCDCAAGACKRMEQIRKACPNCPGCDCAAGECKATKTPIS